MLLALHLQEILVHVVPPERPIPWDILVQAFASREASAGTFQGILVQIKDCMGTSLLDNAF